MRDILAAFIGPNEQKLEQAELMLTDEEKRIIREAFAILDRVARRVQLSGHEQRLLKLYQEATHGQVFLLYCFDGLYRLGWSKDAEARIKTLQAHLDLYLEKADREPEPRSGELVHVIQAVEPSQYLQELQEQFEAQRISTRDFPDEENWAYTSQYLGATLYRLSDEQVEALKWHQEWTPGWYSEAKQLAESIEGLFKGRSQGNQ